MSTIFILFILCSYSLAQLMCPTVCCKPDETKKIGFVVMNGVGTSIYQCDSPYDCEVECCSTDKPFAEETWDKYKLRMLQCEMPVKKPFCLRLPAGMKLCKPAIPPATNCDGCELVKIGEKITANTCLYSIPAIPTCQ